MKAGQGLRNTAAWARASRTEVRTALRQGGVPTRARVALLRLDAGYGRIAELADECAAEVDVLLGAMDEEVLRGDRR